MIHLQTSPNQDPSTTPARIGITYIRLDTQEAWQSRGTSSPADWIQELDTAGIGDMVGANNLSEITVPATARTNLGLGTIATQNANNVTITGGSITGMSTPSAGADVTTKAYVDALWANKKLKDTVRVASTANVVIGSALENGDTLNGVTLATGDRVLLAFQTDPKENGVYLVPASGAASRTTDADTGAEIVAALIQVIEGTLYADSVWICTNDAITIGVTNIDFKLLPQTSGALLAVNNLSELTSPSTARSNLGLGTLATQNGTFSGTSSGTNTGDQTNISGNAATVTTNANLTGPVTSAGNATAVTANAITNTMLADMAANSIKLNNTGSSGDPIDGTADQAVALLSITHARRALKPLLAFNFR